MIKELGKLDVPIYAVDGNWDFEGSGYKERNAGIKLKKYSEIMKKLKNISFLNKRHKKFNELNIFGFGGFVTASIYLTKDGPFEDKKDRDKQKKKHDKLKERLMKKGKKDIDVFLSHYPLYGLFDKVKYKGYNPMNGKHVGFKPYTEFIKKFKPKIFVCGHMHEYQGKKKMGNTIVVATGSAKEGKAAIIEIIKDDKKKRNKDKIKIKFVK